MNIDIISVGNIKEKYFQDAIKEYTKRLNPYVNIQIIEVEEYKLSNKHSQAQIQEGMDREADQILSKIKDRAYIVPLCIEGKQLSSEDFADKIERITIDGYSDICFIIGGSYGLHQKVKSKGQMKFSFSKMTFPHQLMRVVLVEQIYRAFRILKNEPYHK